MHRTDAETAVLTAARELARALAAIDRAQAAWMDTVSCTIDEERAMSELRAARQARNDAADDLYSVVAQNAGALGDMPDVPLFLAVRAIAATNGGTA